MIGTHTGPGILGVTGLQHRPARPFLKDSAAAAGTHPRWASRSIPPNRREPPVIQVIPAYSPRIILRTLFIAVLFAISLYLIYLLRKPIGWVLIATFLAVALSGPVNLLNQYMRRGFAISIVYLVPAADPDRDRRGDRPAAGDPGQQPDPEPARVRAGRAGLRATATRTLRSLEEDYNITEKLQSEAEKLPGADRRRGQRARRHRPRRRQLAVRAVHDPRAGRVPARQRARLDQPPARAAAGRAGGADPGRARPHGQGGRRVRRRRARPGHARRGARLHPAVDPGRAVRGRARDRDLLRRPRAAGRRDASAR